MEVFVRSPNWIGDCAMAIPAIRALKDLYPDVKINIVTKTHLKAVFNNIKEINRVVTIPGKLTLFNLAETVLSLKKYKIETGILFTNSFISAFLFRLSGIKNLTGYNRDMRGFLLKKKIRFPESGVHQRDFYMELVKTFTGKNIKRNYSDKLEISNEDKENLKERLSEIGVEPGKKFIGISPMAAYGTAKQWPEDKFAELIKKIKRGIEDSEILLFGSPAEKEGISKIAEVSGEKIIEISEAFSLSEAISIISMCRIFVSNDSGLLHIASALDIPAIGIFGPTLPEKTAPVRKNIRVIYKSADCSPCKHRTCPIDHRCMELIKTGDVYSVLLKLLKETS